MIHKHSITKNILDATPVILGAAQGSDMVTFAYGSLKKALNRTGNSGEIEFGYDEATGGGQILVGGTPVTSKILDITSVQKANASTGVKTITFTYVDPAQKAGTGKSTSTFEVIDDAAVKAYVLNVSTDLIGTTSDSSALNTINAAKNYAKAAGWSINYDSDGKKIQLKEQGGAVISEINANAFIKDGMLDNASFVTTKPSEGASAYTGNGPWLVLTWNTDAGKSPTVINVDTLVDTYSSGDSNKLTVSSYVITPVTADPSTASTEAQRGALATAGQVKDYVDAKVADKNVTASGETGTGALVEASATNNAVTVSSTQKLQNAVALAESAIQGVAEGSSTENYVALTVAAGTNSSTVTIAISDAALKTKVDEIDSSITKINSSITNINSSITDINSSINTLKTNGVTAAGDTLVSAAQDSTDKFKINVAATSDLTTAVANANSAVQSGAVGTNATNFLTNVASSSTLTVNFAAAPIDTSTGINNLSGTAGGNQFVTAKAIKEYVDSKNSAALSWIMLDTLP